MKKPYIIKTYPSGLRLIVQPMKGFKSVSMGVNVHTGSCNETKGQEGISHFVEHMLFKGTKSRPRDVLLKTLANLGIQQNAFTSNTNTHYYCATINDNIEACFDVLSDMYFNLQFSNEDLETERGVVLQEIAMYEDYPMDVALSLIDKEFFKGTCFEHQVLGTKDTIKNANRVDLENYIKQNYIAPKTIISVAGDVSVKQAETLALKYFEKQFKTKAQPELAQVSNSKITPNAKFVSAVKDNEQHSVVLAFPFVNFFDDLQYNGRLLSTVFGKSMTSRLYTEVREKQGLVYHIGSFTEANKMGGFFGIMFGCTPKNTEQVLKTIKTEIEKAIKEGITDEELKMAQNMEKTVLLWRDENVNNTKINNAMVLSNKNEILTTEQTLNKYQQVKVDDINNILKDVFNFNHVIISLVGPKTNLKPLSILK